MKIRVACLGAGYFSQFHTGSWKRLKAVDLVGICDHDMDRASAVGIPAFDDIDRMLTDTQPDILDIILPPAGHVDAIQKGITSGIKTIICQKPFCQSLEEAQSMVKLAQDSNCTLIIHENFRFQPWYRAIKSELEAGRIGDVLQATFRLRPGDGQGPDAYLDRQPYFQQMPRLLVHETGVHFIDLFRYLFGKATAVYADLRKVNPIVAGEDAGYILFTHPDGLRTVFDGNRCLDHAADNRRRTMGEALIEGKEGTLYLTGDGAVTFRPFGNTDVQVILAPDTHEGFGGDCTHALQSHVVDALLNDTLLENLAADYLYVIKAEEAIYRAAAQGCKVIF